METKFHLIDTLRRHFKFLATHIWVSSFIIYIALGFLVICQVQQFKYYWRLQQLGKEYVVISAERITLCSSREFGNRTSTGIFSGVNQVAVSQDLKKYKNWYAILPGDISKEIYLVTDVTHDRFKATVDIYSYQPVVKAKEFGVKKGKVLFISEKGLELLGTM